MVRNMIAAFFMVAATTLCASAQTSTDPATAGVAPPPSNATADTSGQDENNQVICREERVTGTLFPSRICHTKHQWDVMRQRSQEMLRGAQQSGGMDIGHPANGQ
jgi:hypothetical protein